MLDYRQEKEIQSLDCKELVMIHWADFCPAFPSHGGTWSGAGMREGRVGAADRQLFSLDFFLVDLYPAK